MPAPHVQLLSAFSRLVVHCYQVQPALVQYNERLSQTCTDPNRQVPCWSTCCVPLVPRAACSSAVLRSLSAVVGPAAHKRLFNIKTD